jgi:hypothetical protein
LITTPIISYKFKFKNILSITLPLEFDNLKYTFFEKMKAALCFCLIAAVAFIVLVEAESQSESEPKVEDDTTLIDDKKVVKSKL